MSAKPLEFHTREQLASALSVQRDVTEDQRLELAARAERIAILEARLARTNDPSAATLRAHILAWLIREQREIVYQFNDQDFTTMERACECTGDEPTRKVAAWIVGILASDFIFSESALRGVLRHVCSRCQDSVCSGNGCVDGSTELQISAAISRLMLISRPRRSGNSSAAEATNG